MVFSRNIEESDYDPNMRPTIDGALLNAPLTLGATGDYYQEVLGLDRWGEIELDGTSIIDEVDGDVYGVEVSKEELLHDLIPPAQYNTKLNEWMRDANNALHGTPTNLEHLVQDGITLATVGAFEMKKDTPNELITSPYEKKLDKMKEYITRLIASLGVDKRQEYNDMIDELAEHDSRWERVIFKNDLGALKRVTYQTIINKWAEEVEDNYSGTNPRKRAAEIIDRGLKIIKEGKTRGLTDIVIDNSVTFYDCLSKLSEFVGENKARRYERQYRAELGQ